MMSFEVKASDVVATVAVIISIIALYFSRRNLKIEKYIETVTKIRIEWISQLRNDLSEILALAAWFYHLHASSLSADQFEESTDFEYMTSADRAEYYSFLKRNAVALQNAQEQTKGLDAFRQIELLILKLNSHDDTKLIQLLERLKLVFIEQTPKEITSDFLSELRSESKRLLKNEWERAKMEVESGHQVRHKGGNGGDFWES